MISSQKIAPRGKRLFGRIAIGTALVASLSAAVAFKTVFARPGESALRLVPADALVVGTIDLSPSPGQTLAFKKIDDALKRNGLDSAVQGGVAEILEKATAMADVKPYLLRSVAVALWSPDPTGKSTTHAGNNPAGNNTSGALMIGLSDGPAVNQILEKKGVPQFYKGSKSYRFPGGKAVMAVMDDLLVLAQDTQAIYHIQQVRNGDVANVLSVADFQAARQQIASDANVMAFMNPKILDAKNSIFGGMNFNVGGEKRSSYFGKQWMATGMAVRDNGLEVVMSGKMDVAAAKDMEALFHMVALRSDLFKIMPAGSYGMLALSQPASYFEGIEKSIKKDPNTAKALAEMESKLPEQAGINLRHDLLPAFKGDTVVAAYPGQTGKGGLDILVVIDDLNGADPVNAAKRLQDFVMRKAQRPTNLPPLMASMKIEGADEAYGLSEDVQTEVRNGLNKGLENGGVNKDLMVADKTFVWAVLGKSLVASTSKSLLEKTIGTMHSQGENLSTDPKFASAVPQLMDGSQMLGAFSLSRIAEGVRATLGEDKMQPKDKDMYHSVMDAVQGLAAPFFMKTKTAPDGQSSMSMFIPLDYDAMIDLAGKAKNTK